MLKFICCKDLKVAKDEQTGRICISYPSIWRQKNMFLCVYYKLRKNQQNQQKVRKALFLFTIFLTLDQNQKPLNSFIIRGYLIILTSTQRWSNT